MKMYLRTLRHLAKPSTQAFLRPILARCQSAQASTPLRILFCGSDEFSCASLRALHAEQQRNPAGIASIDVLCRPGKPAGRNLKVIREVPIKAVAAGLGLTVHERDTFTGWDLPRPGDEPINLIVAVSFGLFVPPRILRSAEYGGLNVHPSLLPHFRGPAPLQHIILNGFKTVGVTLQTMDEKDFDHGIILAQTAVDFRIDIHKVNYEQLLTRVTPMAADILVQGIRDKVYVPPYKSIELHETHTNGDPKVLHAPKTTAAQKQIDWRNGTAYEIDRQLRALGDLWTIVGIDPDTTRRLIFKNAEPVLLPRVIEDWCTEFGAEYGSEKAEKARKESGIRFAHFISAHLDTNAVLFVEDGDAVIFKTADYKGIRVKQLTLEGSSKKPASQVMQSMKEDENWNLAQRGRGKHARHFFKVERKSTDSDGLGIYQAHLLPRKAKTSTSGKKG